MLSPASWQMSGPANGSVRLNSAYGLHIVRVSAIEQARVPPFEAVKDTVKREWLSERRSSVLKEQYEKFRARYQVTVQYPPAVRP